MTVSGDNGGGSDSDIDGNDVVAMVLVVFGGGVQVTGACV